MRKSPRPAPKKKVALLTPKPEVTRVAPALSGKLSLRPLTIVGIGASAGGLEAIEQFLASIPLGSTLALVIVQHLEPTHPDLLPELLQRVTPLTVTQAKEKTRVRPDYVYVIPPGKDLSIQGGVLHLQEPQSARGHGLPINFFFRSLAEDQKERSVAVVLSGMGIDGTEGVKAIKEQGGVVLVQDPAQAKFPSMPRSVADAGLADIVAPTGELCHLLQKYLQHISVLPSSETINEAEAKGSLGKVVQILRAHTGHDFSLYKHNTLYRRIERRMGLHQLGKIDQYVGYLQDNPQEVKLLFRELLIGVTHFFRDPEMWEKLEKSVLPLLMASGAGSRVLRAWVPGCSTGEEAYSLAIVFKETLDSIPNLKKIGLKIFATDIDPDAVSKARQGLFPESIVEQVSPERLNRFFVKEAVGYRITKEIREMVIFAQHNLIMDPPFTKLDLLSCRNLLIYFTPELQKKLLPLFYYSLNPGGVLFLGSAETIGGFGHLFTPFAGSARLFQRREVGAGPSAVAFPMNSGPIIHDQSLEGRGSGLADNLQTQAEQWLIKHHAPAAVLVTVNGDVLFISGRTGRYLEPVAGKANWNLFAMVREGLRYELTSTFQSASQGTKPVISRVCMVEADGAQFAVNVTVEQIADKGALQGLMMVIFKEMRDPLASAKSLSTKSESGNFRVRDLTQELLRAREEVLATREAMQISQEELKSSNEELQSTNEELQSTNEELTTAQEELQSLNEELQTVNAELQAKVDELSSASNDMRNLLNSTQIATLFLDRSLRVRFFTEHATELIHLIPGDVGRPVTDLAFNVLYPDLATDSKEVLRKLVPIEKALDTRDGRCFALRVMPYRTMDNRIDGVVITFTDITIVTKLEAKVREQIGKTKTKKESVAPVAMGRAKK